MVRDLQQSSSLPSPLVFWDNFGFKQEHSGIGRYAQCLWTGLQSRGLEPLCLTSQVLSSTDHLDIGPSSWVEAQLMKAKLFWPNYSFHKLLKKLDTIENPHQKKIFHGLANINLPFAFTKTDEFSFVLTIHDLIPLLPESGVSKAYKLQFSIMLPRSIEMADVIICVSQWTYDLVRERFPRARNKSFLVPHGMVYPRKTRIFDNLQNQIKKLLFVSRWEAYKGFELIDPLLSKLPSNYQLDVITDNKGEQFLNRVAASHMLANRLKVFRSVSEPEMERFYEASSLYLHFSRYEGYGLPVWEALLKGTPAVFLAGHACDSLNSSGVALGIEQNCSVDLWADAIVSWSHLKATSDYQRKLADFLMHQPTWIDTAEKVKALYNSII